MWILGLLLGGYATFVVALYVLQDRLLFPGADRGRGMPLPAVQGVSVDALQLRDGRRFRIALGEPAGGARGVLLFFIGNGEDLRSGVGWAAELCAYGVATVVVEYPGYGDSDGEPSFVAIMAAAEVAADFAAVRAAERGVPLLVGGSSLGAFPAVHVAARGRGERLLLLSPPTRVADLGSQRFPWLPVRLLLRHPFDSLAEASAVRCPALVLHGDRDSVVPLAMGQAVAQALRAELVVCAGAGHTGAPLAADGPFAARVRAFLVGER